MWNGLEFSASGYAADRRSTGDLPRIERKYRRDFEARGYATRFETLHQYKGKLDYILPGAFAASLKRPRAIRLTVDHDESKLVATSADLLELHADNDGLAFRCDLSQVDQSIIDMIGDRRAMSYKSIVNDFKMVEIKGRQVKIIFDEDLLEITFCHHGTVAEAFAVFGTSTGNRPLAQLCKSGELLCDGSFERLKSALKTAGEKLS